MATTKARVTKNPQDIQDAALLTIGGPTGLLCKAINVNQNSPFLICLTEENASRFGILLCDLLMCPPEVCYVMLFLCSPKVALPDRLPLILCLV
jgi:hypothetical protein